MRALTLLLVTGLALGFAPAPFPSERSRGPGIGDVKSYLRARYAGGKQGSPYTYSPGARVDEVSLPALRKHFPHTRFFVTRVRAPFLSYPEVETLVAVTKVGRQLDIRDCFSPVFTGVNDRFLARFQGVRAGNAQQRGEIVEAIGSLFARITYQGKLRNGAFGEPRCRVELWTRGHYWRTIGFTFDEQGRLRSVSLSNVSMHG